MTLSLVEMCSESGYIFKEGWAWDGDSYSCL